MTFDAEVPWAEPVPAVRPLIKGYTIGNGLSKRKQLYERSFFLTDSPAKKRALMAISPP